jgi:predicted aconitase
MNRRTFFRLMAAAWGTLALFPTRIRAEAAKAKDRVSEALASVGFRSNNDLGGSIGTDPMFCLTTYTGHKPSGADLSHQEPKMILTEDEQEIMDGKKGPLLQKAMKTIVAYGELFGAKRLVDLDHAPHIAMSWGTDAIIPFLKIYEQFAEAGIKTYAPFTSDPKPFDYVNLNPGPEKEKISRATYSQDGRLTEVYEKLGMMKEGWTCVCYAPEVGNVPKRGDNLSWSESSAINYVNSAIGARTNRTTMGIDMLTALLGKTPEFGLMTEEGRKAKWLIEVKDMPRLPHPEMVGSAIGLKVLEDVPYIVGMDKLVGDLPDKDKIGYLKDLGAATASNGAVGLYHMEGVTPEAIDQGRDLLAEGYQTYVIDWPELKRVYDTYPNLWPEEAKESSPDRVFIGCPVNTRGQLEYYGKKIIDGLKEAKETKVAVPTYLFAHRLVADAFRKGNPDLSDALTEAGVSIALNCCPMMFISTPKQSEELIVTNSNKTRVYSTARFFPDFELIQIVVSGKIPKDVTGGVYFES